MHTQPYLLHALSSLHVGTGQTVDTVDLPIARMRATGIPFVPGSSIKGVLRDVTRPAGDAQRQAHIAIFGPTRDKPGPEGDASIEHAGALIATDARLLALPVRSARGVYAMVTSPLLLELARRDLLLCHAQVPAIPAVPASSAQLARSSLIAHDGRIYLEDIDLDARADERADAWATYIAAVMPRDERALITRRLAIIDDESMAFLWHTATQVDTHVRIDPETHVVEDGALWTQENLPPETLLIGVLAARASMRKNAPLDAPDVLARVLSSTGEIVQFGGKATTGYGRCRMRPWQDERRGA